MSKFVHTAAAIVLPAAIHRRLWAQHYVALWRALFTREQRDKQTHAYRVLHAARAPSPPLAIAKSRASFLRKLSGEGPTLLTRLLYDHWALHPRSSWLGQIHEDVQQVCLYLPNLASIFSGRHRSSRPGLPVGGPGLVAPAGHEGYQGLSGRSHCVG